MEEKILSLIIPSYNAERFLRRGLDSFLISDGARRHLEVWVISDGSSDRTDEIAKSYAVQYPDVFHFFRKENGGHGSAINAGVKLISGKYFKVIDADDWVDQKGLETLIHDLADCDSDVVISNYQEYDIGRDRYTPRKTELSDDRRTYQLAEIMEEWDKVHACMTFWGITYRTDFYLKQNYQLLEGVFYEDQEYATIPLSRAESISFSEAFVYVYRLGDVNQSVSGANQVKRIGHLAKVIKALQAFERQAEQLSAGGFDYWKKKTSMVIVSFYQITLLVNRNRVQGEKQADQLNRWLEKTSPTLLAAVWKKYRIFMLFHRIHMSEAAYKLLVPPVLRVLRRMKVW